MNHTTHMTPTWPLHNPICYPYASSSAGLWPLEGSEANSNLLMVMRNGACEFEFWPFHGLEAGPGVANKAWFEVSSVSARGHYFIGTLYC